MRTRVLSLGSVVPLVLALTAISGCRARPANAQQATRLADAGTLVDGDDLCHATVVAAATEKQRRALGGGWDPRGWVVGDVRLGYANGTALKSFRLYEVDGHYIGAFNTDIVVVEVKDSRCQPLLVKGMLAD